LANTSFALEPVKEGYPSERFTKSSIKPLTLSDLLFPADDFRRLFVTRELLQQRIARKVCVFDGIPRQGAVEVPVAPGDTVKDVLSKVQMEGWHGEGPQLKVIKQDLILQGPYDMEEPALKEKVEALLRVPLSAGDFVFISPRI
jgi:hypothetical protein